MPTEQDNQQVNGASADADRATRSSTRAPAGLGHSASIPSALPADTTEKDLDHLAIIFEKTKGEAWEPPSPNYPWLTRMVAAGFLRRCDMRCGFEAFRDSGLTFTDAGRIVLHLRAAAKARQS